MRTIEHNGRIYEEPDSARWIDAETGYRCTAIRNQLMHNWCGYVSLPKGHRLFGLGYDDEPLDGVRVHGGLTYADHGGDVRGDDGTWVFGFDCAHAGDFVPGMAQYMGYQDHAIYRDLNYVKDECARLAMQLAARSLGESKL